MIAAIALSLALCAALSYLTRGRGWPALALAYAAAVALPIIAALALPDDTANVVAIAGPVSILAFPPIAWWIRSRT